MDANTRNKIFKNCKFCNWGAYITEQPADKVTDSRDITCSPRNLKKNAKKKHDNNLSTLPEGLQLLQIWAVLEALRESEQTIVTTHQSTGLSL